MIEMRVTQPAPSTICGIRNALLKVNELPMVMLKVCVTLVEVESATCTVKLSVPEDVGVPVMVPELENDKPCGNAPESKFQA